MAWFPMLPVASATGFFVRSDTLAGRSACAYLRV
jgi:hypothetical protein